MTLKTVKFENGALTFEYCEFVIFEI